MEFDLDATTGLKVKPALSPKRPKPNFRIDPDITQKISQNYNVLPIFEKQMYDYVYLKHYSMKTNELLKHQFEDYKNSRARREPRAPIQFHEQSDFHFLNCSIKYKPDASWGRHTNFPFKLKTGPGLDNLGQIPIAAEHLEARHDKTIRKYPKKYEQEKGRDRKNKNYPKETNSKMASNIKN